MRLTLEQFLNKIGVETILRPYETIPYDYFNPEKGTDVMADVSLSGDGRLLNAEIQQIEHGAGDKTSFKQILQLQLTREPTGVFMATSLRYNGQQLAGKKRNWFEGACRFIKQSVALIKKGTVPDFDAIYKATIDEAEGNATAGGSGGGRALKGDKANAKPPTTGGGRF
jgi:hypothetical protein